MWVIKEWRERGCGDGVSEAGTPLHSLRSSGEVIAGLCDRPNCAKCLCMFKELSSRLTQSSRVLMRNEKEKKV